MLSQWMIVCGAFLLSFVLSSVLFFYLPAFDCFRRRNFSTTGAVVLAIVISSAVFLGFCWNENDIVSDFSLWNFLAPLIGVSIIFLMSLVVFPYSVELGVLVASFVGVFGGGLYVDFFAEAPLLVNKLFSVAVWFLFSLGIRCVAMLYPVLQIQGITIALGLLALFVLGAFPFMYAIVVAAFLGAMAMAYLNYVNRLIAIGVVPILGYIIAWFGFLSYGEMLLSCYVVLTMFCLLEMAICLLRRICFPKQFGNVLENSVLVQAYKNKLNPILIIKSLWVLSVIVVVFAVFQVNGVNLYSIPAFVAIVVLWQFYRMLNWREEEISLKEKNKEIVDEIKGAIKGIVEKKQHSKKVEKSESETKTQKKNKKNVVKSKKIPASEKTSSKGVKKSKAQSVKSKKGQK